MRIKLHALMRGDLPKRLTCYTGAEAIPLLLAAGGTVMQYSAQQDAQDRRQTLANAMTKYRTDNANKQVDLVNNYIAKDTPDARATQLQQQTADAKNGYDTSVGA